MAFKEITDAWASIYANSPATRSAIMFAHVGALVVGGGTAIAADLDAMRKLRQTEAANADFDQLQGTHRLVISCLSIVVASGVALMLADFDSYVASTAFWIKMAVFVALIVNGALLVRAPSSGGDAARVRRRVRTLIAASVTLWLVTTLLGTVVPNVL
ncbi:MAG TPA: hypothetical protein VF491_25595 [Vicinamibacterales bacterium]